MKQQPRNAEEARFLRRHYKDGGYDEQQQQQDNRFKEDFEKAINSYSKKAVTNNVEKQIEYFGYKMEPFNMKDQQEMGQIDDDGYFVFTNKRRFKDAWLQSLNDDGEDAVDNMRKKIKLEQRQKTVYQVEKKHEEAEQQDQEDNSQIKQQQQEEQEEIVDENKLKPAQIRLLLAQMLPFSTSANQYIKKLKKQKNTELVDKILLLCNEYIDATGQHDILTLKKEDLEEQAQQQQEAPINNWDDDPSEEIAQKPGNKEKDEKEQDDIF